MTDDLHPGIAAVPRAGLRDADRVCDAFEAAWRDGRRPRIADFCPGTGSADLPLLTELVGVDVEYRRMSGEEPRPDDYLRPFPRLPPGWLNKVLVAAPAGGFGTAVAAPGQRFGRFDLLRRVGRGACGAVWLARDPQLDRSVALKLPHPALAESPVALERFRRESRAAARLRHPGIAAVFEVTEVGGLPVAVQEFVDGPSLRELLAGRRPGPREAAELVAQAAEALDYAHREGAVHRDVKPANLLVAPGPPARAVVVDFGLALRDGAETLTADGQLVGTPAYMSPEQAAGRSHAAGPAADVYGLGAVLYELLTGQPPFRGTTAAIVWQVVHEEPRPPRRLDPAVSRDLETVCLKSMAKEPRRRYPTAGELAADLRRFLGGEPVAARPLGAVGRAARLTRRHPAAAATLATVLAAGMCLTAGSLWYNARLTAANAGLAVAAERERLAAVEVRRQAAENRERAELGRRSVFAMTLTGAPALWRGDALRVRPLLHDPAVCPPELRDFVWRHLDRRCDFAPAGLPAHGSTSLPALAMTPDGSRLVTGAGNGRVCVWDLAARTLLAARDDHTKPVFAVAVLPDRRVATADAAGRILVRRLDSAEVEFELAGHGSAVRAVAWVGEAGRLASGGDDGTVRLWDVANRREVRRWTAGVGPVLALAASAGRVAAAGGERPPVVRLWRAADGQPVAAWPFDGAAPAGEVTSLDFSPDGRLLAEGSRAGRALIRDVQTGRVVHRFAGTTWKEQQVHFSPDGRLLATGGFDGHLRFWDVDTGDLWTTLAGDEVLCLAVGPGGRVAAASDRRGSVALWRLPPFPDPARFPLPTPAHALATAGGTVFAGTRAGEVWAWPVADPTAPPQLRVKLPTGIRALAGSPDGHWLAVAGHSLQVRLVCREPDGEAFRLTGHTRPVRAVAFSACGTLLASAADDETVRVWRLADRAAVATLRGHAGSAAAVAFAPDGRTLATAGDDGTVRLWDAETWQPIGVVVTHTDAAVGVAFDPSGTLLASGGRDRVVRVYDLAARRERYAVRGYTNGVTAVAFSPDGKTLLTASGVPAGLARGEVKLLDAEAGYVRAGWDGCWAPLAVTADGGALLVTTADGVRRMDGR